MGPVLAKRILILGVTSIWRHRLRSSLTILGIVFGVCSVIAMLAIGEGASYEAQEQIKKLGSQNIIVQSVKPPQSESAGATASFVLDYGLTYKDAERIQSTIPNVQVIVSERSIRADMIAQRKRLDVNAIGTVPWYPDIANKKVDTGRFINPEEMDDCKNVCVMSKELATLVFPVDNPIGQTISVKGDCFTVIGVMEETGAKTPQQNATQLDLYIPLTAAKARFGEIIMTRTSGSFSSEKVELHKLIVRVDKVDRVIGVSEVVRGILDRGHKDADFEIIVPLELLRQAERTKQIFNIVLGSIAAISLLVGGIGIMNIMLASVTERTREIGIRRALGAKRRDILVQFLTETVLLSACGGVVGLLVGVIIPFLVTHYAGMMTIVRLWSLGSALGISVLIGLIFGIYPAYRACMMNPIAALRHE